MSSRSSGDEPFTMAVNGKPFAVVPYTLRNNDIVVTMTAAAYLRDRKGDFDLIHPTSDSENADQPKSSKIE